MIFATDAITANVITEDHTCVPGAPAEKINKCNDEILINIKIFCNDV